VLAGLTKPLRRSLAAFFVVLALLIAVLACEQLVPAGWRGNAFTTTWQIFSHYYTDDLTNERVDLIPTWTLECTGHGVIRSYRVVVTLEQVRSNTLPDNAYRISRSEAINKLATDAQGYFPAYGAPEAAAMARPALENPGTPLSHAYPERALAERYVQLCTVLRSWMTVIVLLMLTWVCIIGFKWRTNWRRIALARNVCRGCGYDMSGIGSKVYCPECGRFHTAPGAQ
jgi:hypothetical protein